MYQYVFNKLNNCNQFIFTNKEVSLSRVNEPEQEETDQRVMTLFPALNLEALRVAADTLVPRFIPAIPKKLQRQLPRSIMLVQVLNQLRLSEEAIQSDNP
ncbi:Hypothetical_protein [Hexamita inflata]|uniref:Hypothetical_protein n=1 Tax=Hexamita inflata TaxID=28002 RepID=A0AA86Q6J0_9EUKA|nr:Hypothetical protein HINF_LOCUS40895 [Hexamita inflata]CAI9959688.1 Hypothetical protein HINF_LOCUS47333 [Hexamita inflata]